MKYEVYFEHINQTRYTREARSPVEALASALKTWKDDNLFPSATIEDEHGHIVWPYEESENHE